MNWGWGRCWGFTFILVLLFSCATQKTTAKELEEKLPGIHLIHSKVVDGSMLLLEAREQALPPGDAEFEGKEYPFIRVEDGLWICMIPVAFNSPARMTKVTIESQGLEFPVEVESGKYAIEHLPVEDKYVKPSAEALEKIEMDKKEVGQIYRQSTQVLLWKGRFIYPIASDVTSPYGNKRFYNGEMRNFHSGLDLRAKIGTPVKAAQTGTVVLAKDLYFTGNTVFIDHGFQLYTFYAHLSKIKVKTGDLVQQGDVIGLSGKTGRVSGPHLHWSVVLNGEKLDPAQVLKLNFPTK